MEESSNPSATSTTSAAAAGAKPHPLLPLSVPDGIRSRFVDGVNGLRMHVLEAGHPESNSTASANSASTSENGNNLAPTVILLHGFPELAYSWRKVMLPLAAAGFHVVAPDQRGFGRTTKQHQHTPANSEQYRACGILNLASDIVALTVALQLRDVAAVIGHDFGSPVAAWCALTRPDIFRSCVLMSAPFSGAPTAQPHGTQDPFLRTAEELETVGCQHYQRFFSSPEANDDLLHGPDAHARGAVELLRGYFWIKSGDWGAATTPTALSGWNAKALQKLPEYYVLRGGRTMAATIAKAVKEGEGVADIEALALEPKLSFLTPDEVGVYAREFQRTGFQGGLDWYRANCTDPCRNHALTLFAGRRISVPVCFIAGEMDWGIYQSPGAFESMSRGDSCANFVGSHFVKGAGHWVQQERPFEVVKLLLDFLPPQQQPQPRHSLPNAQLQVYRNSGGTSSGVDLASPTANTAEWTLAIVGLGVFGQFLAKAFSIGEELLTRQRSVRIVGTSRTNYAQLAVSSWSPLPGVQSRPILSAFYESAEAMLEAERPAVILFCTSILSLDTVAKQFPWALVKDGCVVAECCSVKEYPEAVLRSAIPPRLPLLLTHPMFGPNSAGVKPDPKSWTNRRVVYDMCTAKGYAAAEWFLDLFRERGATLIPLSAAQHDADSARTQFLTHFLSRSLPLPETAVDTATYRFLRDTLVKVAGDSDDLFTALYRANSSNCDLLLKDLLDRMQSLKSQLTSLSKVPVNVPTSNHPAQ